jgi:hypothetical protein
VFGDLAMRHARTSFLGLPRITVRRMMIYVAVILLAIQTLIALPLADGKLSERNGSTIGFIR